MANSDSDLEEVGREKNGICGRKEVVESANSDRPIAEVEK